MHANFAILELLLIVLYILCAICAALSFAHPAVILLVLALYAGACNVSFHQNINLMKIDVSGYNSALSRTIFLHIFSIVSFTLLYYNNRERLEGLDHFVDAFYFSAAMWTTLGFEDIKPRSYMRLVSVFQAFSGLIHFAMFISMYWFYAQSAMEGASRRSNTNTEPPIRIRQSRRWGFMELVDADYRSVDLDASRYDCLPCKLCASEDLRIKEYYNWHHEFVHIPNFAVVCESCGAVGPSRNNAVLAARLWNKARPELSEPLRQTSLDGSSGFEGDLIAELIRDEESGGTISSTGRGWRLLEPLTFWHDPSRRVAKEQRAPGQRGNIGTRGKG